MLTSMATNDKANRPVYTSLRGAVSSTSKRLRARAMSIASYFRPETDSLIRVLPRVHLVAGLDAAGQRAAQPADGLGRRDVQDRQFAEKFGLRLQVEDAELHADRDPGVAAGSYGGQVAVDPLDVALQVLD